MTKNELDQTLRNSSNLPEDLRANREKANKNVGYLEHIKQSIIFNRNVVNTKLIFRSVIFLSVILIAKKLVILL